MTGEMVESFGRQWPRYTIHPVTNHTLLRYTRFRWSLRRLEPGASFAWPISVHVTKDEALQAIPGGVTR